MLGRHEEAERLDGLAAAAMQRGQLQPTIEHLTQALAIYRETGDRGREGSTLGNLGCAYYYSLGQQERAIEHHTQALAIFREVGDRQTEGKTLVNLGNAYSRLGQHDPAVEHYTQALAISRELDDRGGEGRALRNLGNVYGSLEQYERATEHLTQALAISRETGDRKGEGSVTQALAIFRDRAVTAKYKSPRTRMAFNKPVKTLQSFMRKRRWWRVVDSLSHLHEFRTLSGPSLKLVFADGLLTAAVGPPKWTPLEANVRSWCAARFKHTPLLAKHAA